MCVFCCLQCCVTADGQSLPAWGMETPPWSVSFLAVLSVYDCRHSDLQRVCEVCATFRHGSAVFWESLNVFCYRSGNIQHSLWHCKLVHWQCIEICCIPVMSAAQFDAWHVLLYLAAGLLLPSNCGRSSRLTGTFCSSHHHYSMCSNHSLCSRCSMISTIAWASAAFRADTHQLLSKSYDICMSVIGFSSTIVHSMSCHFAFTSAATAGCMAGCEPYRSVILHSSALLLHTCLLICQEPTIACHHKPFMTWRAHVILILVHDLFVKSVECSVGRKDKSFDRLSSL